MGRVRSFVFLLALPAILGQIFEFIDGLNKTTDFTLEHYDEINFDGLLGFIIAEAQIKQSLKYMVSDFQASKNLEIILKKCKEIRRKIIPILPQTPKKMLFLEWYLLRPKNWVIDEYFKSNTLQNLGIYTNWTVEDIIKDKSASYKGVPSDYCLMEILQQNCYMSPFCSEMMLAPRIDKGYLLSHRLFYLQILRLRQCHYNKKNFHSYTKTFCSLMLKELQTNDYLGFPAHDIALEQMVLCGLEGYSEFLDEKWKNKVLEWQTPQGCYHRGAETNSKRSSNIISYGCSDHTTGLGAAALAINLKFILEKYL